MLCEGYQLYLDFVVVISVESRLWQMLAFSVLIPAAIVAGDLAEALGIDWKTAFLWTLSCIPFQICFQSFAIVHCVVAFFLKVALRLFPQYNRGRLTKSTSTRCCGT
jgi:hypothetical protein